MADVRVVQTEPGRAVNRNSHHTQETTVQVFFDAVRDVVGEDGVGLIQSRFGGRMVNVPAKPGPKAWLLKLFDQDKVERICASLAVLDADGRLVGLPKFTIPHGIRSAASQLVQRTDELLLEGRTAADIACELRISERTVFRRRAILVAEGKLRKWFS